MATDKNQIFDYSGLKNKLTKEEIEVSKKNGEMAKEKLKKFIEKAKSK